MEKTRNIFVGVLAIILGLIVILFPLISVFTINKIAGIGIIFLGIWFLAQSFKTDSLAAGIASLILAIFAIIFGIVFIGDIKAFEFFTFIALYIVGFFIALAGITSLISGEGLKGKAIGALGIIIGIIFVIVGSYVGNPLVLAAIIGAFLIIAGIMEIFDLFNERRRKIMIEEFKLPPFLRQVIVIAVIFVALLGMKFSAEIVGPILLSMFISIIILPFFNVAEEKGFILQCISYNNFGWNLGFRCGSNRFSSSIISSIS